MFSIGGLWVCAGGLIFWKLTKSQLIYSASCFNFGGLGVLFGGANTPKAPAWWRDCLTAYHSVLPLGSVSLKSDCCLFQHRLFTLKLHLAKCFCYQRLLRVTKHDNPRWILTERSIVIKWRSQLSCVTYMLFSMQWRELQFGMTTKRI